MKLLGISVLHLKLTHREDVRRHGTRNKWRELWAVTNLTGRQWGRVRCSFAPQSLQRGLHCDSRTQRKTRKTLPHKDSHREQILFWGAYWGSEEVASSFNNLNSNTYFLYSSPCSPTSGEVETILKLRWAIGVIVRSCPMTGRVASCFRGPCASRPVVPSRL